MGQFIENTFVRTYETNVQHLSQQGITRLRPWVMERSKQAESHAWERIAAAAASEKTTRKQETPDNDTAWSRRLSMTKTFDVGDVTEQEDIVQVLTDPNSSYAQAHGMAMRRAHDDEIIRAAYGDAIVGTGGQGTGVVTFPTSQIIGDGTSPLTYDLITAVAEKFLENDVEPDEKKCMVVTPAGMRRLLQMTEAVSADYNAVRPLQSTGYVENFMGFTWIVSTRLTLAADQPTAGVNYIAMTPTALGMHFARDITSRVAEDPSISFSYRIYNFSSFGCCRVHDERIVHLNVDA